MTEHPDGALLRVLAVHRDSHEVWKVPSEQHESGRPFGARARALLGERVRAA